MYVWWIIKDPIKVKECGDKVKFKLTFITHKYALGFWIFSAAEYFAYKNLFQVFSGTG